MSSPEWSVGCARPALRAHDPRGTGRGVPPSAPPPFPSASPRPPAEAARAQVAPARCAAIPAARGGGSAIAPHGSGASLEHSPCEVALPFGQGGIVSAPGDYEGGWKSPSSSAGCEAPTSVAGEAPRFARGGSLGSKVPHSGRAIGSEARGRQCRVRGRRTVRRGTRWARLTSTHSTVDPAAVDGPGDTRRRVTRREAKASHPAARPTTCRQPSGATHTPAPP